MNDIEVMVSANELAELAKAVLQEAKRQGASHAEVGVTANKGFTVSARQGDVETVEYHQDKAIGITVYFGQRLGAASINDMRPESYVKAVAAACHIAKFTGEDPASGLADPENLAFQYPTLDLGSHWPITVNDAITRAKECEAFALQLDSRIMSAEEVSVATSEAWHVYANTHGFVGHFPSAQHEMSCVLVAKDQDGMQRDYGYTVATDPQLLYSTKQVAEEAVSRTVQRLGARSIPTAKVPVLYHAEEARSLIGHFASAISGGAIYRKSSFLVDHLNKSIFREFMEIYESPFLPKALGSAPFDDDGVATRENHFVERGVIKQYALGTYAARKLGMKTTGNAGGFHNLLVKPTAGTLRDLIKQMHKGLLITEIMGQGVNLLTGDYSRGVAGFWVENGEIQFPVHEVTVAGTLQDIYARIAAVGNDIDPRGNILTGSILVDEMTVAGR